MEYKMEKKLLFTLLLATTNCVIKPAESSSKTPQLILSAQAVENPKELASSKTFKRKFHKKRAKRKEERVPQPSRLELLLNRLNQLQAVLEQQKIAEERVARGETSRGLDIPEFFQLQHFQELSKPNCEKKFENDRYYNVTSDDEFKELVDTYSKIAREKRRELIERIEKEIIEIIEEI
jgi:hypothetical protein